MVEVFHLRKHRVAAALFWAFNGFGIFLWITGLLLTVKVFAQPDPTPISPILSPIKFMIEAQEKAAQAVALAKLVAGTSVFAAYTAGGLLSLFLAQTIRYLASITESIRPHAEV